MAYDTNLNVEEKVSSLFQADSLLPEQFLDTYRRKTHLAPETSLMLAVLEDAVACFQKYVNARDGKGLEIFRDAEQWIVQEEPGWLFSFANICEALGLNPEYVRAGLMRWKEAALRNRPKAKVYDLAKRKSGNAEVFAPLAVEPDTLEAAAR